jgi:hypothetical protein
MMVGPKSCTAAFSDAGDGMMVNKILIGSTGFIGMNLQKFIDFNFKYNSTNLDDISFAPDNCNLFLCCLPATKWMINKNPGLDLENAINIFSKLKNKEYNKIFLFSTIDVYQNTELFADETTTPVFKNLGYGHNRYIFEDLISQNLQYNSIKILRLPGLYGPHLKKNIIFDIKNSNNLDQININSYYQWYNIERIKDDLDKISKLDTSIVNMFPEPVYTKDIIESFCNEKIGYHGDLMTYDYQTNLKISRYWYDKWTSLSEIGKFLCK